MSSTIDFTTLTKEISEASERVAKYSAQSVQYLDSLKKEQDALLHSQQSSIKSLLEEERAAKDEADRLRKCLAKEKAELDALKATLTPLRVQESALPEKIGILKALLSQERDSLSEQHKVYGEVDALRNAKIGELRKAQHFYEEYLGIKFERILDDRLQVIFSSIDPALPARRFVFTMVVDSQDIYRVEECVPMVEGLAEMVTELNKSNDFSGFIRGIRRKFRQKV
eukprot:CAMPEP_0184371024 /NCGR_PEP_ID=MMETSP1089-20130417/163164_1 /TAXON_ID=38269 ORGANISM="Gloeochaete wittrockiana, Strain SAG46.84" /NCGR_SAMPLE_ID=MMETSP1089 /ASSEMBLY_ACC=CAM_ASM_000445 /LENGTH=225 /DNA_ID=CAMNT_0026713727 /DNA_START=17 /DNA_END=694 /DNA_ORIENTATION=-